MGIDEDDMSAIEVDHDITPDIGDADGATDFVRDFVRRRGLQPPTEEQVTAA
jgi:hypothetical protein